MSEDYKPNEDMFFITIMNNQNVCNFLWKKYRNDITAFIKSKDDFEDSFFGESNKHKLKPQEVVYLINKASSNRSLRGNIIVQWIIKQYHCLIENNLDDVYKKALVFYFYTKICLKDENVLINEENFCKILKNENRVKDFVDKNIGTQLIIAICISLEVFLADHVPQNLEILKKSLDLINTCDLNKISDLNKIDQYVKQYYKNRKSFLQHIKPLCLFLREANSKGIEIYELQHMLKLSPIALAQFISEHQTDIFEHMKSYLAELFPSFDAKATFDLLNNITPRPEKEDFNLLSKEISDIDSGKVSIEGSDFLNIILPVIQGQKSFDILNDGEKFRQNYSIPFALSLHRREFKLTGTHKVDNNGASKHKLEDADESEVELSSSFNANIHNKTFTSNVEQESLLKSELQKITDTQNIKDYKESDSENINTSIVSIYDIYGETNNEQDDEIEIYNEEKLINNIEIAFDASSNTEKLEYNSLEEISDSHEINAEEVAVCAVDTVEEKEVIETDTENSFNDSAVVPIDDSVDSKILSVQEDSATNSMNISPCVTANDNVDLSNIELSEDVSGNDKIVEDEQHLDVIGAITDLIDNKQTAALYWLSTKIGTEIPTWLTELLHLGLHLRPNFTNASYRTTQLLNDALREYSNLTDRQSLLFVGAIIRPMLFLPQTSYMPMLSHLAARHKTYSPFIIELRNFVSYSKSLDERFITQETALSQRKKEFDSLIEETREFWQRMRKVRLTYKPATDVHHFLFGPKGLLGQTLDACLKKKFDALEYCLAQDWSNTGKQALIDAINARVGKVQRRRTIEASARTGLFADIEQTLTLLKRWSKYVDFNDSSEDQAPHLAILAAIRETDLASTPEERLLQSCLAEWKRSAEVKTTLCTEKIDPSIALTLWPLVLPFDVNEARPMEVLQEISRLLKEQAWNELDHPGTRAVARQMMRGNLVLTDAYLQAYKPEETFSKKTVLELAKEQNQKIDIEENSISLETLYSYEKNWWRRQLEVKHGNCLQKISEAYFRGSILFSQQAVYRETCESIIQKHNSNNTPLLGLQAFEQIENELGNQDKQQEIILNQRLDQLQKQAEQDNNLSLQKRIVDIRERIVKKEQLYSDAYLAISDIEEHLESGIGIMNLHDIRKDILSYSKYFYDALENNSDKFVCKDSDSHSIWISASSVLRRFGPLNSKDKSVLTKLIRQIGFSLERDENIEDISAEGAPCFWRIIRCGATINSPLPQWGSRSEEQQLFLLGWNVTAEKLQQKISNSLGSRLLNRNQAVTIICFNSLSYEERTKYLAYCKTLNFSALLIDSNLYNWLSSQDNKVESLFGATLAGSVCNPYTPNVAGAVPPEMFFGRENLISELKKPDGPCIVYGGRQLGKTALLLQIVGRKAPELLVCHFTMPSITSSLFDVLINELHKCGLKNINRKNFERSIISYLEEDPKKRILVLADECDQVLESDCERGCDEVRKLSTIMQETNRRFKIVLTGLHSVQRFNHVSNVPLIHYGTSICVGPLSPNEARNLLVEPLNWLGIDFEDNSLPLMAINHCNYHPKVIQMLGEELLKVVMSQYSRRQPLFTITKQILISVLNSKEVQKKIVECFEITLNLDERYLVIGYVMALLLLQLDYSSENISSGAQLTTLYDELCDRWPAAFREQGSLAILETLLEEMEGLGLLIAIGGTYRLRTPNIINLLGGEDIINAKVEAYRDKPYEPKPNLDEWRVENAEALVASQYNRIAEKKNGLIYIVGSRALGLDDVPGALQSIAREQALGQCIQLRGTTSKELMTSLRKNWDKKEGDLLLWTSSEDCAYLPSFLLEAAGWLKMRKTEKRIVRIICLMDPSAYFEFCSQKLYEKLLDYPDVSCLYLHPWSAAGLETWYKFYKVDGGTQQDPSLLLSESGGWHALLFPELQKKQTAEKGKVSLEDYFSRKDVCFPEKPEVIRLLNLFVDFDELNREDCLGELVDLDPEHVDLMIKVLQDLHVLKTKQPENESALLTLAVGVAEGMRRRGA